ncbi:hypothetical protein [Streptomyces sp. NPDC003480]
MLVAVIGLFPTLQLLSGGYVLYLGARPLRGLRRSQAFATATESAGRAPDPDERPVASDAPEGRPLRQSGSAADCAGRAPREPWRRSPGAL